VRPDPGVVLVVGAGSGIGRATARLYAGRGSAVVLAGRGEEALEETAAGCRADGAADVLVVPTDVTDAAACQKLVDAAVGRHGRVDACVHCSGVAAYGRLEEIPLDAVARVLQTNVLGALHVARAVVPVMRAQGSGTLVLVGSVLGRIAVPKMGAYVTSKWALRGLARVLSLETRDVGGLEVCLVAPGSVDTAIYAEAGNWTGRRPRPPWPVATPESVARAVARTVAHPRRERLTGWASPLMVAGSAALPRLYDALVGTLMGRGGFRNGEVAESPGNLWRASRGSDAPEDPSDWTA
jgi:NAD(P)-dependent dehydrogenase (short-subunit alcohol dehydrogenase family)